MKLFCVPLIICILLLSGCDILFPDTGENIAAQGSTEPTPTPSPLPTATPNIPVVDTALPTIAEAIDYPIADWPNRARLSYMHPDGVIFEAAAELYAEEGFVLYLMKNTGNPGAGGFMVEDDGDGKWRARVEPTENNPYDTGEGLYIHSVAGDSGEALNAVISDAKGDSFSVIHQDSLAYWNQMSDSTSMLYGAVPYEGVYTLMQNDMILLHILLIESEIGSYIVTLRIEQQGHPTQLYYYLCSMLSTFRVKGEINR